MTVRELIAKLQTLPSDLPVYVGTEAYALDQLLDAQMVQRVVAGTVTKRKIQLPERVVIG